MKRWRNLAVRIIFVLILLPIAPVYAQKSLPQVPITYPGDTTETIIRRAQLVDGAKKEGEVVWWGSVNPGQIQTMASEFNKIYPFIKVNYWRGRDDERITRLETEHASGHLTADISDSGDIMSYARWRTLGLVDKYTDVIPGIKNMDKGMYSKHGDWAILGNNAITPQYNTKLVSPAEAPKIWEDLLNPKWKGTIGMAKETRPWYVLALGEGGWGIEKTEGYLRKLKEQNIIWTAGLSAGHGLLIAGEYKIMAFDNLRHIFESQQKGAPVDWCRVKPIPITGGTYLLAKKAPHPNAARLFIEWQFSPQGLAAYEKITGYGAASPGTGTRLAKILEGLPLIYRTEEITLKVSELHLVERFSQILGITLE